MIDLDTFFGLEKVFSSTDFAQTGGLYALHLLLLIGLLGFGVLLKYTIGKLSSRLDHFFNWFGKLMFTHTLVWGIFYGIVLLVIGDAISLSKYLYIYFTVLITLAVAQTHIESVIPKSAFLLGTSNTGEIIQSEAIRGTKPS